MQCVQHTAYPPIIRDYIQLVLWLPCEPNNQTSIETCIIGLESNVGGTIISLLVAIH